MNRELIELIQKNHHSLKIFAQKFGYNYNTLKLCLLGYNTMTEDFKEQIIIQAKCIKNDNKQRT